MKNRSFLILTLALAIFLRSYSINNSGFTFDELSTLAWTSSNMYEDKYVPEPYKSTTDAIQVIKHSVNFQYPPLYYLFVWNWVNITGDISEISLRLITIFMSLVGIIYTYLLGKRLFNPITGAIAAFIFTILPYSVFWSRQAVNYHIFATFFLMSMYYFIRVIQGDKVRIIYIVATCLAIFVNNYVILLLIIQLISALSYRIFNKKKSTLWYIPFIIILIAFAIYSPIYSKFATNRELTLYSSNSMTKLLIHFVFQVNKVVGEALFLFPKQRVILLIIIIGSFILTSAKLIYNKRFFEFSLIFSWSVIPFVATSIFPNVFRTKCFVFLVPVIMVCLSYVISYFLFTRTIIGKGLALLIFGFICFSSYAALTHYFQNGHESLKDLAVYLKNHSKPNDTIIISHSYPAPVLQYYLIHKNVYPIYWKNNKEAFEVLKSTNKLWYIKVHESWKGYNEELERILDKNFPMKTEITKSHSYKLIYYSR